MNGYYIGLMSGTSADGIDAALVEIEEQRIRLVDFLTLPLNPELKQQLTSLNHQPQISLNELCQLQHDTAQNFIAAVKKVLTQKNLPTTQIRAIGSHGQTIFHAPEIPMTLQVGHPAFIAKHTRITTVADFRVDDMALDGQGAPFAPAFHHALFSQQHDCFVVNIGGIANISFVPAIASSMEIKGWDTGPGNALMDELAKQQFNSDYDKDGKIAQKGSINHQLLDALLDHPYFFQTAPKSTGRDCFNMQWVDNIITELKLTIAPEDLMATLCELTAITISREIQSIEIETTCPVWVCGGGALNSYLIERIQVNLNQHQVASSEEFGIEPESIEAMMFAWFAYKRLLNQTIPLCSVTGACRNAVLGGVWHP